MVEFTKAILKVISDEPATLEVTLRDIPLNPETASAVSSPITFSVELPPKEDTNDVGKMFENLIKSKVEEEEIQLENKQSQEIIELEVIVEPEVYFGQMSITGDISFKFSKRMAEWDQWKLDRIKDFQNLTQNLQAP